MKLYLDAIDQVTCLTTYIAIFKTRLKSDPLRSYTHLLQCVEQVLEQKQQDAARDAELAGRGSRGGASGKKSAQNEDGDVDEEEQKRRQQIGDRDREISLLSKQLKEAGLEPARAELKGASGKGKGKSSSKGSGDRAMSADIKCFTCGENHFARDCPMKTNPRTPPGGSRTTSRATSEAGDSEASSKSGICHFHKPWKLDKSGKPDPKICNKGDACSFTHVDAAPPAKGAKTKSQGAELDVRGQYEHLLLLSFSLRPQVLPACSRR